MLVRGCSNEAEPEIAVGLALQNDDIPCENLPKSQWLQSCRARRRASRQSGSAMGFDPPTDEMKKKKRKRRSFPRPIPGRADPIPVFK
ncbi:hypothetical protein EYF80_012208 [Liparis tanakae]|uniref:Uncharacterized protein n=1 Tax=Liparis tanakae TaxID=230148 RepID=A0A4Z2IIC7_9TELE|nr:hypothetical protein EYF80_012208 [Liparis tanakae]